MDVKKDLPQISDMNLKKLCKPFVFLFIYFLNTT